MKAYFRMATRAFTISFLISMALQFGLTTGAMPWLGIQLTAFEVFVCLASICLPLCAGIAIQIFQTKPPWSKSMRRTLGAYLMGMFLGLVVSAMVAIVGPHDTGQFHIPAYMAQTAQESRESWEQRRKLSLQVESLGMQKTFLECFIPITFLFGFLTVAVMFRYDAFHRHITN